MIHGTRRHAPTVVALVGLLVLAAPGLARAHDDGERGDTVVRSDTVAARLGGFPGILAFLHHFAVPALLADPEIAPFFTRLTETPDDIEQCLAMLLDHDLGGSSPKNGAVLASGHRCRSSMSNIHRGLRIPDHVVDRFIAIVREQAAQAGVAPADIQVVGDVLNRYRGGIRNK